MGKITKQNSCPHYLETGEIFDYKINENRGENIAGVKKTQKIIRNLINNNFDGGDNELFITLTYRRNLDGSYMTDPKRLMTDFEAFWKRFKRKYSNVDYMSIVEPQGNGAWHCHVLIRFNENQKVFIPNNEVLQPMWGHGFTKIKRPKKVDNIGAYFSAYLADLEIAEENTTTIIKLALEKGIGFDVLEKELEDDNGQLQSKKFLKGARLYLYPSGMNLYRCSRGIKKPTTNEMEYQEVKKIVGSRKANYSRTINLTGFDDTGNEKSINTITYEHYNLKR